MNELKTAEKLRHYRNLLTALEVTEMASRMGRKYASIIITLFAIVVILIIPVTAQPFGREFTSSLSSVPVRTRQEKAEEWKERVRQRVTLIIQRYEANKTRHIENYNRIKEKLKQIVSEIEKLGLDVSKLRESCQKLEEMILICAKDYETFIAKLREILNLGPQEPAYKYRQIISEARALFKIFRANLRQVRTFFKTNIHPEIIRLRNEISSGA